MKNGLLQCKDIPDLPLLLALYKNYPRWTLYGYDTLLDHTFGDVNFKLKRAKMQSLMNKKLVQGCPCGCRGDWELTDLGLAMCRAVKEGVL